MSPEVREREQERGCVREINTRQGKQVGKGGREGCIRKVGEGEVGVAATLAQCAATLVWCGSNTVWQQLSVQQH